MVHALYFDGISARQLAVTLHAAPGMIEVRGEGVQRAEPLSAVRISSKLGSSPRLIYFSGGAHCQVGNHAEFEGLLRDAGVAPQSLLARLENSWRHAVAATLLFVVFLFATFTWGLPWAAQLAAEKVPPRLTAQLDAHFVQSLDDGMTQASKLSQARQAALRKRFYALRDANILPPHTLLFRNSPAIGANAFALPGGTVVVTDQLVQLADGDEEVLAVLAHELGHVKERHPLRQLLQSSVVGLAMAWYLGDVSTLLAAAPTMLLETSYSRNFERRADRYATELLRMNGIAPTKLADMLEKLVTAHSAAKKGGKTRNDGKTGNDGKAARIFELISTHPDTGERIREIREAAQ